MSLGPDQQILRPSLKKWAWAQNLLKSFKPWKDLQVLFSCDGQYYSYQGERFRESKVQPCELIFSRIWFYNISSMRRIAEQKFVEKDICGSFSVTVNFAKLQLKGGGGVTRHYTEVVLALPFLLPQFESLHNQDTSCN